jgi:hypothetical protein
MESCTHPNCNRRVVTRRPRSLCFSHRRHLIQYGETREIRRTSRLDDDGLIWCPGCEAYLPRTEYNENTAQPYGTASHCKACRSRQRAA